MAVGRYHLLQGRGQIRENRANVSSLDSSRCGDLNTKCICWRNRVFAAQPSRDRRLVDTQSHSCLLLCAEMLYELLDAKIHIQHLL